MNRAKVRNGIAAICALYEEVTDEAEAELDAARVEIAKLQSRLAASEAAEKRRCGEVADYEKTVANLHERLREEERRRAGYQAVDAAARRLVAHFRNRGDSGYPTPEMRALLDLIPSEPNDECA